MTTFGPTWKTKKLISITCLDLSAAFDTANHSILLEVMENYFGIKNTALKWLSSYLKNTKFSVNIDDFSSNIKTINFTVPQGSILCQTLFNCYFSTLVEMLPKTEENFVFGCADDHSLITFFHPENRDFLKTDFKHCLHPRLEDKNELKINSSKTEFIVFGSKHQLQTYTLYSLNVDHIEIMAKSVIKFLDTYLDEVLNMKTHIANRTKIALYNLYLIKHQKIYYSRHSKKAPMFTGTLTTGLP